MANPLLPVQGSFSDFQTFVSWSNSADGVTAEDSNVVPEGSEGLGANRNVANLGDLGPVNRLNGSPNLSRRRLWEDTPAQLMHAHSAPNTPQRNGRRSAPESSSSLTDLERSPRPDAVLSILGGSDLQRLASHLNTLLNSSSGVIILQV